MDLSVRAKVLIAVGALVGLLVWIVIVDLGVNAGRVHYGVTLGKLELGGLTEEAAIDRLQARGEDMETQLITFAARGERLTFYRSEAGWHAKPYETAAAAMAVGRTGGPLRALAERARAWFGGVRVHWADKPRPSRVTRLIDEVEARLDRRGYELDRGRLRAKIRRSVYRYPGRRYYRIPLLP